MLSSFQVVEVFLVAVLQAVGVALVVLSVLAWVRASIRVALAHQVLSRTNQVCSCCFSHLHAHKRSGGLRGWEALDLYYKIYDFESSWLKSRLYRMPSSFLASDECNLITGPVIVEVTICKPSPATILILILPMTLTEPTSEIDFFTIGMRHGPDRLTRPWWEHKPQWRQQHNIMKTKNINLFVVKCRTKCGLHFSYSQSSINIQYWKNTKYMFQEALLSKHFSSKWQINVLWLPSSFK